MKFRIIRETNSSFRATNSKTKEIVGTTLSNFGKNVSDLAKASHIALGTNPEPIATSGEALDKIGQKISGKEKETDKSKSTNNILNFNSFINDRKNDGSYSLVSVEMKDMRKYPEIYYVKALLPHENVNENIMPIVQIDNYYTYKTSLTLSDPHSSLYVSLIRGSYMLGNPPPPEAIESSEDNLKVEAEMRNNLKENYGTGLEIASYLIEKMATYGYESTGNANLELQEYFYKLIHNYLRGNYVKVLEGSEISVYNKIIQNLLQNL